MQIGVSLPTMAGGYTRATTLEWAKGIDAGPFSSISCGERITFRNQEMTVTNAAAAALTERVRVFVNLVVLPFHSVAVAAKELATLDVLSGGRVSLGVGIGGREHDYLAAGSPFDHRHQRLDDSVAELRRLWSGEPPFEGADPVGPAPVQPGGPEILAGAMGPKALARAAKWADGISGFTISGDQSEMISAVTAANAAWETEGRDTAPRHVTGSFTVLGVDDSADQLRRFTYEYLGIFGERFASMLADTVSLHSPDNLRRTLDEAEAAGVDEFILVPGTTDLGCLDAFADVVERRGT